MGIFISGFQNCGWECRLIGRVGEELGLQTESVLRTVEAAALSMASFGDEVGSVEMDTREGGFCFQGDTCREGIGFCSCAKDPDGTVDHIIVVITTGIIQLIKILLDVGTDGSGRPEIHRGACYRFDGSVRDAFRIAWGVILGEDLNALIQSGAGIMTCQIKIAVIRQIAEGILIRFGLVANDKAIVL